MKYAKMLEGRYALILGGDTEAGGATARIFEAHGARVAVAGGGANIGGLRGREAFAALKSDIPDILLFDIAMDSTKMAGLCSELLKSFPYADILVGATDMYKTGPTHRFSSLDLRHMLDVNLGCAVRCFQELLPGMLERRRGELILFAPDLADAGASGAAAAAACAGAISSFARNVTNDYIRYRVRANTVMYPFGGLYGKKPLSGNPAPEDAANAALWFACYLSRFVVGEKLRVNGGLSYADTPFSEYYIGEV